MIESYKDLIVWKKSYNLTLKIYKITQNFPKHETYGVVSQIRRSVSSIPSNIAEGKARGYTKEYIRFLQIARASLEETKVFLSLSFDLNYISDIIYTDLKCSCIEIGKMLNGLIRSLKKISPKSYPLNPKS